MAAKARPSLHSSKCQIVGNLMHWPINLILNLNKQSTGRNMHNPCCMYGYRKNCETKELVTYSSMIGLMKDHILASVGKHEP